MNHNHFVGRILQIGACGGVFLLSGLSVAGGAPVSVGATSRTCTTTFESAQQSERAGQLVEARQLFDKCANVTCADALWSECSAKERQLRNELSSVVPVVTDSAGEPRTDIVVTMDGNLLTSNLDGMALTIAPGAHEFSFSAQNTVFSSVKLTLAKGEHNRPLAALLPAGMSVGPISSSEN